LCQPSRGLVAHRLTLSEFLSHIRSGCFGDTVHSHSVEQLALSVKLNPKAVGNELRLAYLAA
jgi:hypothetical protein